jgi:endo-1,4-beta-D-glucanase Y
MERSIMPQMLLHRPAVLSVLCLVMGGLGCEQNADVIVEQSDYEAATTTAKRPFPDHVHYAGASIMPSHVSQAAMDDAVRRAYDNWKTNYLRQTGGQGTWVKYDGSDSTVSEAQGYGMVVSAYLGDKPVFDSLRQFYKSHPSKLSPQLMAWKQSLRDGKMVNVDGADSATDGDLDIAYSLVLADAQWGSSGSISYRTDALSILSAILSREVNSSLGTLKPGDWATGSDAEHTRPSDFMTDHFLVFAKFDTAHAAEWSRIYDSAAAIVNRQFAGGSSATGLMPDFMVKSGSGFVPVPGKYLEGNHDGDFHYNACRTPWRLTMSYLTHGRTDMLAALRKQAAWIRSASGGKPSGIRAGYYVAGGSNGSPYVSYDDLAFTAPFAVNAMVSGSSGQSFLNALWTSITGGDYGSKVNYYSDSIRLQVLLTVSGNWWTP